MKLGKTFLSFLLISFWSANNYAASTTVSTVIVINPIVVPQNKESEALDIWDKYAKYFKQQPGFMGTKLHRSIDPKAKFHLINVAKWRSVEDFNRALYSEEIKKVGAGFPKDMPYFPSVYQIIRDE